MSKLGPHVLRPTAAALDWARVAPVVKAVDDPTPLRVAARATVRIFRKYFPVQDVGRDGAAVAAEVLAALGDAPATHVELFNETAQRLGAGLERHVAMTREAIAYVARVRPDLTVVAFSFSTGQPEQADWDYLRAHGYGGARVIGIHEYWGQQGFTPWHALRHRTAHAWTGGDHPPFLVTECGRDRVEGGQGGWRADGLAPALFLGELASYETLLTADPYVIAATPFSSGPTPDWRDFDVDPIAPQLAAAATRLPDPPPEVIPMAQTPGIDVSNNNGPVDLAAVAAAGYGFVAVKASGDEGPAHRFLDAVFPDTWRRAGALELGRIAYHYAVPSAVAPADSVATLQAALDAVGGLAPGDNVALDVEDPRVPEGTSLHVWVAEWLDLAARVFGVVPWKYSARYYTQTHDLEHEDLARYPTWWAAYQAEAPAPVAGWGPIRIWQHAADGQVAGVDGAVDLDVFSGTLDDLRALGLPAAAAPPEQPAPPEPAPDAPAAYDVGAARDRLWGEAAAAEAGGYPWMAAGIRAVVALGKGDR